MKSFSIISILVLNYLSLTVCDVLVTTPKGAVRGRSLLTPGNRTFFAFTGIPFAKPPVGKLRFQAPVEADSWDGVLDALEDPDTCFQVNSDSDRENEDCLYVNVFTPALDLAQTKTKLPVVFGIYGGSFRSGSAGYGYGGPDFFIERDIVIVSFNYRIGPMGFLSTGDTVIPGNAGLKDQQLALQWTYKNIEFFGGNKSHITVQGQSAGGASVTYQLLNKQNEGLIHGALVESGSSLCPWAWRNENLEYTVALANVIDNNIQISNTNSSILLEYLQNVSAREVDRASAILYSWRIPLPTLEPEHDGAFITEPMYELLDSGNIIKVPLFIGINSEEYLSKAADIPSLMKEAASYDANPLLIVPSHLGDLTLEKRIAVSNLIKEAYIGNDTFSKKLGSDVSFTSDDQFTRGIIRFGELYSRYSPVYFYEFSYKGPMGIYDYGIEGAEKVAHGEESHYLSVTRAGSFDNTKPDQFPPSDVLTQSRLIELWSNFYKYGNPTPRPIDLLSNITWPAATPDNFVFLNINETLQIMDTPKSPRYNVWRDVFETFGIRPFVVY